MRSASTIGSHRGGRGRRAALLTCAWGLAAVLTAFVWWSDVPAVDDAVLLPETAERASASATSSTIPPLAVSTRSVDPPPAGPITAVPTTPAPLQPPSTAIPTIPPTSAAPTPSPRRSTPPGPRPPSSVTTPGTVRIDSAPVRPALVLPPGDPLASTALVEAKGCSASIATVGSGVVLGDGLVVTNAHVVAGQRQVHVIGTDGRSHDATVVGFDPVTDLAALAVSGLGERPLTLATAAEGVVGKVAGHPGGGTLSLAPLVVSSVRPVSGTDIYGSPTAERTVVRGRAAVEHGDSGAPLLLADGSVGGIVFASSSEDPGEAWLVTAEDTAGFLAGVVRNGGRAVSTGGRCLS